MSVKGLNTTERTWNPRFQVKCVISQQFVIYELEIQKGRKKEKQQTKRKEGGKKEASSTKKTIKSQKVSQQKKVNSTSISKHYALYGVILVMCTLIYQ